MNLSIVTDCLSRNAGGLFHSVRRPAQELHLNGVNVRVFGVQDDLTDEDLAHWQPLSPRAFELRGPKFFGYAPGLVAALKASQPEVMAIHGLWKYTSLAVLQSGAAMNCPYIVHPHGMLDAWAVSNSRWKKRLAGWAYEERHLDRAACIRALNNAEADAIRRFGLTNPICIIPNAIDLPFESRLPESGQCCGNDQAKPCKIASPFPRNRKVCLYLGRIHPKKNLLSLLHAWAVVCASHLRHNAREEWVLAIAGWDQNGHEAELKRIALELELGERLLFLGPQFGDSKTACYYHCDMFVLPSFSEGLPMAILEAWAYAKPVLMSAQCNLPDGFDASAAIKIEQSPESIAAGLCAVMEMSDAQRKTVGEHGLALVKQRYTWPEVARQMREVYEWIAGGGTAPACVDCVARASNSPSARIHR